MPTTADYLTQLQQDREDLVDNLETKGISNLTGDETFTELVPKILDIEGGQKFRLPDAYQEVEYIQSNGTQYFETDYYANGDSCYDFKFSNASTSGVIFGAYNSAWTTGNGFYHNNTSNLNEYFHYYSNTATSLYGSSANEYTLSVTKGTLFSNGIVVSSQNDKTFTLSYPTYILAGNWAGSRAEQPISCKLYYFKISEDTIPIHEYIPCYRKSDGVIGMYDLIDEEFITNAGSGTFTKGSDHNTLLVNLQNKTETITTNTTTSITADSGYDGLGTVEVITNVPTSEARLPSTYQEVEYIGITDGNSYIDIDYKPTYNTKVVAKASLTSGWLCGEDSGWQRNGFGILKNYSYFSNKYSSVSITTDVHDFVTSKDGYYVDNTLKASFSGASNFTATNNLYIFANNRNLNVSEYGKGNLYSFEIYESDVLQMNLVPCYEKSTNKIGLYDLVTEEFFEPANNLGTWIKGDNESGLNLQKKTITISSNTITDITADNEYVGLKKVSITTNVNPSLQTKTITVLKNGSTTLTPSSGYYGLSSVNISVSVPTSSGGIPADYTQLEYIETNAVGYIELDYKINDATEYEVVSQLLDVGSNDACLMGSRSSGGSSDEFCFWHNTGTGATTETASPRRGISNGYVTKTVYNSNFDWHIFRLSNSAFYVDDSYFGRLYSNTVSSSNLKLYVFALNSNGTADSKYYRGRIKYLKINEGLQPVLYLLPVKRNNDNKVGLYDTINEVFYTNKLSTNFTAGPDVT